MNEVTGIFQPILAAPWLLAAVGGCWLLGAVLLWLGGALAANGRSCAWPLSGGLLTAASVVTTTALWVPAALLSTLTVPENGAGRLLAGAMLAGATAALLSLAGCWLKRRMNRAVVALLPLLLTEAVAFLWVATPLAIPALAGVGSLLAATLLVLYAPLGRWRHRKAIRLACVLLASATLVSAMLQPTHAFFEGPGEITVVMGLLALAMVAGLASMLYLVMRRVPLRELGLAHDSHRRPLVSDGLTQLPTRSYFEKRLQSAAAKCDARKNRMALLFIDLDGFKPVNDTYGHSLGDAVLQQVGKRLRVLSRSGHVAARVGGDEFLLLMRDVESQEDVALLARRLIKHLSQPYQVDQQEVVISCSVGIVLYPDSSGVGKLIARADAAMYAAKRSGGSCYCFYTPAMDADAEEKFELMRGLREAVEGRQFELYYQPKIDARSGKITAVEALIRWQHPTRGLIMPGVFIPAAERFGLMGAIGHWVIEDACRQAREWRDQGLRMRVAINLSAMQIRQEDIAQRIGDAIRRHRIDPKAITCEITESAAMEDTRTTQETLRQLGTLGVHISIDDFGTGYSSLSYLRQLPAEELKIDRSFIVDIDHSPDARSVVDAVVKLAHALGLKVVAEGVENLRQHEVLVGLGCDELQGYLFARPMTARALLLASMQQQPEQASFRSSLFGMTEARETIS